MPALVLWHFEFRYRQLAQGGQSAAIPNTDNLFRYPRPPGGIDGTMSVYPVVFTGVAQLGVCGLMVLLKTYWELTCVDMPSRMIPCVHVWYVWMLI